MTATMIGMFAFLLSVIVSFFTPSSATALSLPSQLQSLDLYPSAPNNTLELEYDDDVCDKSEWDMMSVALAMYKLYWIESQQKDADAHTSKRRRIEVMPPTIRRENTFVRIANAAGGLGSAKMNFFTLIISLLPNLGVRIVNIFALATAVLIAIYILLVRGFGDFLVRSTQSVVIGILFPKSSAVLKEF